MSAPCTLSCRIACALLVLLVLVLPVEAFQAEPPPSMEVAYAHDTGPIENPRADAGVVGSFAVRVDGARWLRLFFERVELAGDPFAGDGARLRITSFLDGAVQELNRVSVRDWRNSSAYFNGDEVLVEVVADPGTGPSRVVLASVTAGLDPLPPESLCGVDNRQAHTDKRMARLLPAGCTTFLVEGCEKCFLTAGHCMASAGVVEFNVPPSTSNGTIVHPPPEDQYSVDPTSKQSSNAGVGNDWGTFGCFPNSNTGLTPYQAQNAGYFLVNNPAGASGVPILQGYGIDSTPASASQTLQLGVGGYLGLVGYEFRHTVDTEGGNSGSPIGLNQTQDALAIHTHGGCTSTGGYNLGTSAAHPGLNAALANAKGVCATGFSFPSGLPDVVLAAAQTSLDVQIAGTVQPGSELLLYRIAGSASFHSQPLLALGGGLYRGMLPAAACGQEIQYYLSADFTACGTQKSPASAPASYHRADVGDLDLREYLDFEGGNGNWDATVAGATDGGWQKATPVNDPGNPDDPLSDGDGSGRCLLTANRIGESDVDGGAVIATSDDINLSGGGGGGGGGGGQTPTEVQISYLYFLRLSDTSGADYLDVEAKFSDSSNPNSGPPWARVARHATDGGLTWRSYTLTTADFLAAGLTLDQRLFLRVIAMDGGADSVVEAGFDGLSVWRGSCTLGENYCVPGALGSRIRALGSSSISANDLRLRADHVPTNKTGLFLYSQNQQAAPFGNGTLCIGGGAPILRLAPVSSGASTVLDYHLDYANLPAQGPITPGSTWNFQCRFRDGTALWDTSDAVRLTFLP